MKKLITICLLFTGMVSMAQDTTVTLTYFDETFAGNQINNPDNVGTEPVSKHSFDDGIIFGKQDSIGLVGFVYVNIPIAAQLKSALKIHLEYTSNAIGHLSYYVKGSQWDTLKGSAFTINYEDIQPIGVRVTAIRGWYASKLIRIKVTYDSTYTKPKDPDPTGVNETIFPDLKMYSSGNALMINNPQELAVTIQNTLGQVILTRLSIGNEQIHVPYTGIYYVTVTNTQGRLTRKLYFEN